MGKLATSNLSVKSILTMLGVANAKAIFYNGATLRTVAELGVVVNKLWLGDACPGATPDLKLSNLRTDRKLSYFKGFGFVENFVMSTSFGMSITSVTAPWITETIDNRCGVNATGGFYQESIGIALMTVVLGGTYPGFSLYLRVYIDNVEQTSLKQTISSTGSKYISLPSALSYPQELKITISS